MHHDCNSESKYLKAFLKEGETLSEVDTSEQSFPAVVFHSNLGTEALRLRP